MADEWDCEAYGPEGRRLRALCFFADAGHRVCESPEDCHEAMTLERQRVFRRINELAAGGSPDFEFLSDEVTTPAQLLDGGQDS